jgi:hypothetical protein
MPEHDGENFRQEPKIPPFFQDFSKKKIASS